MEKILVKWSDGRSKGTTSWVKKSAVKKGTIAVGKKVVVAWGKSKRTYDAEVINDGVRSSENPRQDDNEEPFTFELAAPAPTTRDVDLPGPSQPTRTDGRDTLLEKLDDLLDAVSRVEARLCRLESLEEEVAALKNEVKERCIHPQSLEQQPSLQPSIPAAPLPQSLEQQPLPPCFPPAPLPPPQEMSTPGPMPYWYGPDNFSDAQMTPVLQDISSRANIISPPISSYGIATEVLNLALQGCRSRRNLAGRLAAQVYTLRERSGSNCRGKQGKTALDQVKLKAIFTTCMQQYPLQRLETQLTADKEMRNAIDEVCRKTRPITEPENQVTTF